MESVNIYVDYDDCLCETGKYFADLASELFGKDIVLAHGKDIRESDGIDFCAAGEGIVDFAYMTGLLKKAHYDGDFMLHGIYDEEKMPHSLALIRQYL